MNYFDEEIIADAKFTIINRLPQIGIETIRREILCGLKAYPKYISSKFFYDTIGSELFEEITKLDEYYPTRIETSILSTLISKLNFDFENLSIIELGSGDSSKISLLLKQVNKEVLPSLNYYPIDISKSAIEKSAKILSKDFPGLNINAIIADFTYQRNLIPKTEKRVYCFWGSTIGNMEIKEIKDFLEKLGSEMSTGDIFLLGIDMIKDVEVLEKAYNDNKNITAEFNKNILSVINQLIGTNLCKNDFEHLAYFNKKKNRIEMHLRALKDMTIRLDKVSVEITIKCGETIHTENSHKFDADNIKKFSNWLGLNLENIFSDENGWFNIVQFQKL